jgi:hypothetical protein
VDACRNKFLARERYRAAGLRVPWYTRFPADSRPKALCERYPRLGMKLYRKLAEAGR